MNTTNLPFPERIKYLRKNKGWKQSDLAEKAGIDRNMISYYEKGKYVPSAEALIKIAEVFDISIDYLLIDDIPEKPLRQKIDSELLQKVIDIEKLSGKDKESIKHIIDSLITKNKMKKLAKNSD
ncbi:MAG: helix-turn-helix transcriptional regulator [bacterium]|nr:helix-turn-helix transcriptional regulator [bacterium]